MKTITRIFAVALLFSVSCGGQKIGGGQDKKITITRQENGRRVDVAVNGSPFTSLVWRDTIFKPVLYPIVNASGTEVTRGFPLQPRGGERTDHPHHVGMWLNYGNVNGIDFWGNSLDIPEETRNKTGGIIRLTSVDDIKEGAGEASFSISASWQDPAGKELLQEKTTFYFIQKEKLRIIDRVTRLTATNGDVKMPDTKEGMFAIRVARQLELPSNEEVTLTDANGRPTTIKQMSNDGVSGNYRSSEGVTGNEVWGTKAKWMNLFGIINQDSVSIVICDHPGNPGYPSYWHARGYGLFSLNPFGAKDFTSGKSEMNFGIAADQSTTLRYRTIVSAGKHLSDTEINELADEFSRKY
jgi:hypothetical protein